MSESKFLNSYQKSPTQVSKEESLVVEKPKQRRQSIDNNDSNKQMPEFSTDLSVKLWKEIQGYKTEFHTHIGDLGEHINDILQRHEYEYNQAYNIFVKHKETEIRQLIDQISAQVGDKATHDRKMKRLQDSESRYKEQQIDDQQLLIVRQAQIESLTTQLAKEKEQKDFFHKSALDSKRGKKLLKIALNRMETECDELKLKYKIADADLQYTSQLQQQIQNVLGQSSAELLVDSMPEHSFKVDHANILNQQSLQSISQMSTINENKPDRSYGQGRIQTENLKFEQFLNVVFGSQSQDEQKNLINGFVHRLETTYSEKISNLQTQLEKLRKSLQAERTKNTVQILNSNDLETLFVSCVTDTRRDVMKRKIKTDIANQKNKPINPYNSLGGTDNQIDETLVKIADLTKGRVKLDEFTYVDRTAVLDLFVNSEEMLFKIHDILFGSNPKNAMNNKQLARQPSVSITTLSEQKEKTMMTYDTSLKEFISRPTGFLLGHSSVPQSSRNVNVSSYGLSLFDESGLHKKRLSVQPVQLKQTRLPEIMKTPSHHRSGNNYV